MKYFSKKDLQYSTIIILLIISSSSCERFLDVDDPNNQISQTVVFKDKSTALSALADIYTNFRDNTLLKGDTSGLHILLGCYTDELVSVTSGQEGFRAFYELGVRANNREVDNIWINAYKQIYSANSIIEGIEKSKSNLDEATRNQLTGEALAIRALLHFYLVNIYDDIPYVNTTDYTTNQSISRSSIQEVYASVIKDFKQAELLLNDGYPTTNKSHLNKAAVQLLLARVYLYQKDWTNALQYSQKLISNNAYSIEEDIEKTFLKDSRSAIWQFMPIEEGINTLEGQYFTFVSLPPTSIVLSNELINSFEANDKRKSAWIKTLSDAEMTYSHAFKYKQNLKTPNSLEYSIMLRIEEAYLIAAEAENEMGDPGLALNYLKATRERAGLSLPETASQTEIRGMVIEERRHELFTEGGHRFFDLKRTGMLDDRMTTVKTNWKPYMKILPIPERELLANPNLKPQNNGY